MHDGALTKAYGDPTTSAGDLGYAAWDGGNGSAIVQPSWSPKISEAGVHMQRHS